MEIIEEHVRTKQHSNLQPLHRKPPGLALMLMAVEVRILGTQLETLVMELDRPKTGSRVCGMLCGFGCCNIFEVTHLHAEVKREVAVFLGVICANRKTADGQATLFFVNSPMNFDEVMLNLSI